MKILITGSESYIGESVADYLHKAEPNWTIVQLDVRTDEWRKHDFSSYDTVFHVAGLAHKRITSENEALYYRVNRDLAVEVAEVSKDNGVKHFIFMSSMSVYSDSESFVSENTPTNPDNAYGKSKLLAEKQIIKLASDEFVVSIVRPPMIYGKGCKGNYNALRTIALKTPIFPKVDNRRSMLYIENFTEFMRLLIINSRSGIFYPQNAELVNTTEWVKCISRAHGRRVHMSFVLGALTKLGKHVPVIRDYCVKAFGDSYYNPTMSYYPDLPYQIVSFEESIKRTEL